MPENLCYWDLLTLWQLPSLRRQCVALVAREHALACIERILAEGCLFYGYDAFTLTADDKLLPHAEHSPCWEP